MTARKPLAPRVAVLYDCIWGGGRDCLGRGGVCSARLEPDRVSDCQTQERVREVREFQGQFSLGSSHNGSDSWILGYSWGKL